jgi:hypothetical protein
MLFSKGVTAVHMLTGCSSVYTANARNVGVAASCKNLVIVILYLSEAAQMRFAWAFRALALVR